MVSALKSGQSGLGSSLWLGTLCCFLEQDIVNLSFSGGA